MQVAEQAFHDFGAGVTVLDELADAREPYGDERELSGGKEAVEGDEREDTNEPYGNHEGWLFSSSEYCSSREWVGPSGVPSQQGEMGTPGRVGAQFLPSSVS